MSLDELVERFGGVLSTKQLIRAGHNTGDIAQAVADGSLDRIRHGWYAFPGADQVVVDAVKDRGVLSCVAALERAGLWVPEGYRGKHSRVTRYERRQSYDRCKRYGRPTVAEGAVDNVSVGLQYAARCLTEEDFVIVCDSALNHGKLKHDELRAAFAHAPDRVRQAVEKCEPLAASGTETAARLRLRAEGIKVEVQPRFPGVGWVDLLVGDRLAVELDSRAHHTEDDAYETDRGRDRKLLALGVIPLRLTYRQVFREWATTYSDIQQMLRRGMHRRRS